MIVPPEGRRSARLVLIGEAPGRHEMEQLRPFIGPSGWKLDTWWKHVGLQRSDFYITNVLQTAPQPHIDAVPKHDFEVAFERLHSELASLDDPWVIVPTGNYALYALLGKGKVHWHQRDGRSVRPGIRAHRGSIYEYVDRRGRKIKVIPTLHPATTFRTPGDEATLVRFDWPRIAHDAAFRERRLPQRETFIKPTLDDVRAYTDDVCCKADALAIDIETPMEVHWQTAITQLKTCQCGHAVAKHPDTAPLFPTPCVVRRCGCSGFAPRERSRQRKLYATPYIGCVGFAASPSFSFTIPTTLRYWTQQSVLDTVWQCIAKLCGSRAEKVLQNGMFDAFWLARAAGVQLASWVWDTRAMHHCLDPGLPHDLAYLASIFTRQPFYKDECKDPEEVQKYASNSEALWTYNGIDCCTTLEVYGGPHAPGCAAPLRMALDAQGRMGAYHRLYSRRFPSLLAMSLEGIPLDHGRSDLLRGALERECAELAEQINSLSGLPLVSQKGISNQKLCWLLYGAKGVPANVAARLAAQYPAVKPKGFAPLYAKRGKRLAKTVSVDEVSLRKLLDPASQSGEIAAGLDMDIRLVLKYRQLNKQLQGLGIKQDADGKVRTLYGLYTSTGRLNSQATPMGTGANLQNPARKLRGIFVPLPGESG